MIRAMVLMLGLCGWALPARAQAQDSLVGWWKFDELTGTKIADSSAKGGRANLANGALISTELPPGRSGNARSLWFDGVDDSVDYETLPYEDVINSFTIAFWAKPTAERGTSVDTNAGVSGLTDQRYAVFPCAIRDELMGDPNHCGAGVSVGTNGITIVEAANAHVPTVLVHDTPLKNWVHVAVVYSEGKPTLFINGKEVKTGTASLRTVHAGGGFGGTSRECWRDQFGHYQGWLDDVRIYSKALTAPEIRRLGSGSGALDWPAGVDPEAARIQLKDGSVLYGKLEAKPAITIATGYGRLAVPIRDLRGLDVWKFRKSELKDLDRKLDELIAQLTDVEMEKREKAQADLDALGAICAPQLGKAADSADPETRNRCRNLLKTFEARGEKFENTLDVAELVDGGRLRGWIEEESISAMTSFGEAKLPISKVASIAWCHAFNPPESSRGQFLIAFRDGGSITGSWESGDLLLKTPHGDLRFPPADVDSLVGAGKSLRVLWAGSSVEGRLAMEEISIKTRFGMLKFPVVEMVRMTNGPSAAESKIK